MGHPAEPAKNESSKAASAPTTPKSQASPASIPTASTHPAPEAKAGPDVVPPLGDNAPKKSEEQVKEDVGQLQQATEELNAMRKKIADIDKKAEEKTAEDAEQRAKLEQSMKGKENQTQGLANTIMIDLDSKPTRAFVKYAIAKPLVGAKNLIMKGLEKGDKLIDSLLSLGEKGPNECNSNVQTDQEVPKGMLDFGVEKKEGQPRQYNYKCNPEDQPLAQQAVSVVLKAKGISPTTDGSFPIKNTDKTDDPNSISAINKDIGNKFNQLLEQQITGKPPAPAEEKAGEKAEAKGGAEAKAAAAPAALK